uniref:Uncharacterized protein n=2 Tax=Meloidogyne TaxID=189290 RepID=A0A915M0V9_MELJA
MTATSGQTASRGKKKHFLNKFVVRKYCYGYCGCGVCLVIAGFILILFMGLNLSWYNRAIYYAKERKGLLSARSKFEAYFQSECPIYPFANGSMPEFDYSYCNRYCNKNEHMEFMYRIIKPNESKEIASNKNVKCPYYVVLRPCQCDKFENGTKIDSHCEAKKFNKEFISISIKEGESETKKLGICIPCEDDSADSKIQKNSTTVEPNTKKNG